MNGFGGNQGNQGGVFGQGPHPQGGYPQPTAQQGYQAPQSQEDWRRRVAGQIADAQTFEGGNYFEDGNYASLTVLALKLQRGYQGTSFIAEFRVDASAPNEEGVTPAPAGSDRSCAFNMTKQPDTAYGNIKKLALALTGYTPQQLEAEQADEYRRAQAEGRQPRKLLEEWILDVTDETKNRMRGARVAGSTFRPGTREEKSKNVPRSQWKCFMKFSHIPGQNAETIRARRAELDGGAAPAQYPTQTQPAGYAPPAHQPAAPAPTGSMLNKI